MLCFKGAPFPPSDDSESYYANLLMLFSDLSLLHHKAESFELVALSFMSSAEPEVG
jgi:hypothetical protein